MDDYREFYEFDFEIFRKDSLMHKHKVVGYLSKRIGPGPGDEHHATLYVIAGAALDRPIVSTRTTAPASG